ncbi:MAG: hypothetical protein KGY78_03120 [Anaerolineae bacterium]|nr:hypothetical protein [Anaerolineae bacterium]
MSWIRTSFDFSVMSNPPVDITDFPCDSNSITSLFLGLYERLKALLKSL